MNTQKTNIDFMITDNLSPSWTVRVFDQVRPKWFWEILNQSYTARLTISINRPRSHCCLIFVDSKSATRIYRNTRLRLASAEGKARITSSSISWYLERSHGGWYGNRTGRVVMGIMHVYAPVPYRPPRSLVDMFQILEIGLHLSARYAQVNFVEIFNAFFLGSNQESE